MNACVIVLSIFLFNVISLLTLTHYVQVWHIACNSASRASFLSLERSKGSTLLTGKLWCVELRKLSLYSRHLSEEYRACIVGEHQMQEELM